MEGLFILLRNFTYLSVAPKRKLALSINHVPQHDLLCVLVCEHNGGLALDPMRLDLLREEIQHELEIGFWRGDLNYDLVLRYRGDCNRNI